MCGRVGCDVMNELMRVNVYEGRGAKCRVGNKREYLNIRILEY